MRKIFVLLLALMNAACATSTYMPLNPPNEKQARVYIIREHAAPTAWNFWVDVDGKRAASLSNKSFVAFSVDLGTHQLSFDWPALASRLGKLSKDFDFPESKSYYFLVRGSVSMTYEELEILRIQEPEAKALLDKLAGS